MAYLLGWPWRECILSVLCLCTATRLSDHPGTGTPRKSRRGCLAFDAADSIAKSGSLHRRRTIQQVAPTMASVSSLDKDYRKLRLEKYTPGAANEARGWIEGVLGEPLRSADLLEALKDGVALCKLVNLVTGPPGVNFKQSAMPFVQMENICLFLRACQQAPLSLQQHDMFLTVDLFEQKDPAQVLQCIGAFSRAANKAKPAAFPNAIGPRANRGSVVSPQSTGPSTPTMSKASTYNRAATLMTANTAGSNTGRWSPTKSPTNNGSGSPGVVSSWSKREHEGATSPAWNITQYGYMGGASQGNLGIAFGGRRQITSAGPHVPNLAETERRRKEAEQQRRQTEEEKEERRRRAEREAEAERVRSEEKRRWEAETRRLREQELRTAEDEKRRWEEEERQWKMTEEKRRKEEEEAEARAREKHWGDGRLRGQFLSQYKAEQETSQAGESGDCIKQLETKLELARQREAEYERELGERCRQQAPADDKLRGRSGSRAAEARSPGRQESWSVRDDRQFLLKQRNEKQQEVSGPPAAPRSARPLPDPATALAVRTHKTGVDDDDDDDDETASAVPIRKQHTGSRPLPDPAAYAAKAEKQTVQSPSQQAQVSRTDRYLSPDATPASPVSKTASAHELGITTERDAEDQRRQQAQQRPRVSGWASKSLLEREMEMERQRQREWEEAQKETAKRTGEQPDGVGSGVGGRWDVSQFSGYTGGDNQNRGSAGIGAGRRQIVGPRPLPGRP